jgi:hypothetical protein
MGTENCHTITKLNILVIDFLQKIGNSNLSQHITSRNAWCAIYVFVCHLHFLSHVVPKEMLGYFVLP